MDSAVFDEAYFDPALCTPLLERLHGYTTPLRFMEVCGTHTVSLFRSGLRSLLPANITHLSGPGCPVCVTHEREIAACIKLAEKSEIILTSFGDLLRVPGPQGMSLQKAKAQGASVEIVYSPLEALTLAKANPERQVVFIGVGFETTAPTAAAVVLTAHKNKIDNFSILSFHKLVPPALRVLLTSGLSTNDSSDIAIDAFLLPGHVSTILGLEPYRFLADEFGKVGVISGFAPADMLQALLLIQEARERGIPLVQNQYKRGVSDNGNPKAREILSTVFMSQDALWRGMEGISGSGLAIRPEYAHYDAMQRFNLALPEATPLPGCQCGAILKGQLNPTECRLFGTACTPATPVGPCMVSTEGSCAAYFNYGMS